MPRRTDAQFIRIRTNQPEFLLVLLGKHVTIQYKAESSSNKTAGGTAKIRVDLQIHARYLARDSG
jgi:hypothetical protein